MPGPTLKGQMNTLTLTVRNIYLISLIIPNSIITILYRKVLRAAKLEHVVAFEFALKNSIHSFTVDRRIPRNRELLYCTWWSVSYTDTTSIQCTMHG